MRPHETGVLCREIDRIERESRSRRFAVRHSIPTRMHDVVEIMSLDKSTITTLEKAMFSREFCLQTLIHGAYWRLVIAHMFHSDRSVIIECVIRIG